MGVPKAGFAPLRVNTGAGEIEIGTLGTGAPVIMLPGRGGAGIEQFAALGAALAAAGYRGVAVNPRGVGASRGALAGITLHDLAADVAAVVEHLGGPAHVVGRALGNRVARCLAVDAPQSVKSLCLIAAGGLVRPVAPAGGTRPPPGLRLQHWRAAGLAHQRAAQATPLDHWWSGGTAPMLVIQGLDDPIAVPETTTTCDRDPWPP